VGYLLYCVPEEIDNINLGLPFQGSGSAFLLYQPSEAVLAETSLVFLGAQGRNQIFCENAKTIPKAVGTNASR
jgi:hypothetical protein